MLAIAARWGSILGAPLFCTAPLCAEAEARRRPPCAWPLPLRGGRLARTTCCPRFAVLRDGPSLRQRGTSFSLRVRLLPRH